MKTAQLFNKLDHEFKTEIQEDFDNSGPQIVFHDEDVMSILISLDIDRHVVDDAIRRKSNIIITHHPLIFVPIGRIDSSGPESQVLIKLINNKISVYSAHTNLDKIYYDKLGHALGLKNMELLDATDKQIDETIFGYGSMAYLEKPITLYELLKIVKVKLGIDYLIYAGDDNKLIKSIAALNGAGGKFIQKIISRKNIDCIITGDVGYHHVKTAIDNDVAVIDAGHFGTEYIILSFLMNHIGDCLTKMSNTIDIPINISDIQKNPFKMYNDHE